jgi:hypothetical protein
VVSGEGSLFRLVDRHLLTVSSHSLLWIFGEWEQSIYFLLSLLLIRTEILSRPLLYDPPSLSYLPKSLSPNKVTVAVWTHPLDFREYKSVVTLGVTKIHVVALTSLQHFTFILALAVTF